jgi:tetratricopeptide (TPR) repeat protein
VIVLIGALVASLLVPVAGCGGAGDPANGTATPTSRPLDEPTYVRHREAADEAFARGDARAALQEIARALDRAPSAREPYDRASTYWTALGDDAEAARFFDITTRLAPDAPWSWYYRGFHRFRAGSWGEALEDFRAAAERGPEEAEFRFRQGLVLQAMGEFDAAVAELRAARERDPASPVVADRLARVLRITGDDDGAARVVEEAIARSPASAELQTARGELMMRSGQRDVAERAFRRALEIDPARREAHHGLARLLATTGRIDQAERHEQVVVRLDDYVDAGRSWSRSAAAAPDDPAPLLALADLELTDGHPETALRWLAGAEQRGADADRIRLGRAEARFALGEFQAADAELATLDDPSGARFDLVRAVGFLARGDAERARAALDRARDAAPDEREFLRRVSDVYAVLGDAGTSDAVRRRAVRAAPAHPVEPSAGMETRGGD